jgi:hypothetical protein
LLEYGIVNGACENCRSSFGEESSSSVLQVPPRNARRFFRFSANLYQLVSSESSAPPARERIKYVHGQSTYSRAGDHCQ